MEAAAHLDAMRGDADEAARSVTLTVSITTTVSFPFTCTADDPAHLPDQFRSLAPSSTRTVRRV
jgi:hypothetical protein